MAGVSRLQYTDEIRFVRVMCSGRVDLEFIFRGFLRGVDGVFIGGCNLNECNYITNGNYDALGNVFMARKIMEQIGMNPKRLQIEFMSSGDGNILAEVIDKFTAEIRKTGQLGKSEGIDKSELNTRLNGVMNLVPYVKLVERERMRVPERTEEGYREFFTSSEFDRLFRDLIADKLILGRIMALLREKPVRADDISEMLGLSPSEVSRHLNYSAMQGLIRFEGEDNFVITA